MTELGPVLAGWVLGKRLEECRLAAGASLAGAAHELGVNPATIRRWELAEIIPKRLSVRALADYYRLGKETRIELEDLLSDANEPGWWEPKAGEWAKGIRRLLGIEMAASRARAWHYTVIPGLLQTPDYARLVMKLASPGLTDQQLQEAVDLRMRRQEHAAQIQDASYVIDEGVFARLPDGEVMRGQIERLLALPDHTAVQIMPFSAGPGPQLEGQGAVFTIFDFDCAYVPSAVYVEGLGISPTLVEIARKTLDRYGRVWGRLHEQALSREESRVFLEKRIAGE